jgi:hypothetical protein
MVNKDDEDRAWHALLIGPDLAVKEQREEFPAARGVREACMRPCQSARSDEK